MDYKALGRNIRKYRSIAGLLQEDLAEKCECSNSHIGQIENAKTIPSLDMVVRIANALSVTVDQLIGDSYDHPELVYLKDIAVRVEKYSVEKRIKACESLSTYLDALEKFSAAK